MSSTGGPNNRPHNPLTFNDIDQTKMNLTDGAFPAMAGPHLSTTADQVHAAGEIWSSALLGGPRLRFVQRLGWAVGNRKVLQLVTDAMKITPLNPTFLQVRRRDHRSRNRRRDDAGTTYRRVRCLGRFCDPRNGR